MKKSPICLLLIFPVSMLIGVVFQVGISNHDTSMPPSIICKSDAPMTINGNAQLASASSSGSGTAGNPYIIKNKNINGGTSNCISISNTNKYFALTNCRLVTGHVGISFFNVTYGTIANSTITNMAGGPAPYGINFTSSNHNQIINTTALSNGNDGFYGTFSNYNTITSCNFSLDLNGLYLSDCSNNVIANSTFMKSTGSNPSGCGIYLTNYCYSNLITNNHLDSNNYDGIDLYFEVFNTMIRGNDISSNTHTGGFNFNNVRNTTFDGNTFKSNKAVGFYFGDINCTLKNNVFDGNTPYGVEINGLGVGQISVLNNTFTNQITFGYAGFSGWTTTGGVFANNTFYKNYDGLLLSSVGQARVTGNRFLNNSHYAIYVNNAGGACNNTIFSQNLIANNSIAGLYFYNPGGIAYSKNNTIVNNVFDHDSSALVLQKAKNNSIIQNDFIHNTNGILYMTSIGNNTFYHNNFMLNTKHINSSRPDDKWDNGYPSGGNYWDNYTHIDTLNGPGQNLTGSDGICDSPVTLKNGGQDRYPLTTRYQFDFTPPAISLVNPANNSLIGGNYIIKFDIWDLHLSKVMYNWNSGVNASLYTPFTILSPFSNGVNALHVYANDSFGNKVSKSYSFTIDTMPPVTTIHVQAAYDNGTKYLNSSSLISFTVTDLSPIKVTKFWFDSQPSRHAYSSTFSLGSYGLANGFHSIHYYSTDILGNNETVNTANVYLDIIVPTTSIGYTPAWGPNFVNATTPFTLTTSDNVGGSGIASTQYQYTGSGGYHAYTAPFMLSSATNGTITINYRSTDNVGNVDTAGALVVRIDTLAPNTTISYTPAWAPNFVTTSTTFTLAGSDNAGGSGLVTRFYNINGSGWVAGNSFNLGGWTNGTISIMYRSTDHVGNTEIFGTKVVRLERACTEHDDIVHASVGTEFRYHLDHVHVGWI
ncbi:MAG TPA: right-handed parallel beta-helix repeat-containing protein [Candidatus Lokiarchaeia archaeon]|nr:right-handed parallel beta-helix repeat-containing protein [Candidatus Lokiarchaeia archaeon]